MRTVLAALDTSPTALPVLETALGIADLTDATIEAVHVRTDPAETPAALAAHRGVRFRLLDGTVDQALLQAVREPVVIAAVIGARGTPGGRRPAGHTALHIVERSDKPVVVVPPVSVGASARPIRRLLIPLEGTDASSRPVAHGLLPLIAADVDLVVLHVFTSDTTPRVLDRPARDLQMLGGEFIARYFPNAARIELRGGTIAAQLADVCQREQADLIVLSWSRDFSAGRAAVIRWALGHSSVPVLLLPVDNGPLGGHGMDKGHAAHRDAR
jgi:nucleotide-binding universal stress UspA family protein